MNCFTKALSEICRDNPLAEKWLIAPSLRTAHQWLDSVTRSGQPVVNVQCKTIKGLVLDLAAPFMVGCGLRLVSARGSAIIVDRILNALKRESPGYLTGLSLTHSLSQSVYSSIDALRLAGLDPKNLNTDAFELSNKGEEIVRILEEYLSELARLGLMDYAAAIDVAVEALEQTPKTLAADVLILAPEDLELTAKEKKLLAALATDQLIRVPVDQPSVSPSSASPRTADMLRWILQPSDAPENPIQDGTVSIFRAVGEINEVREVFRRCIERGLSLDEVEILHTDTEAYVPLILETSIRLTPEFGGMSDLFATFEEGIPATYSGPGKALSAWVSWIDHDFRQSDLVKMIQEGIIRITETDGLTRPSVALARELKLAPIFFGRARYLRVLDETIQGLETRAQNRRVVPGDEDFGEDGGSTSLTGRINVARQLRQLIGMMLETSPTRDAEPAEALQGAAHFLKRFARTSNELDNYALNGLLTEIADMSQFLDTESGSVSLNVWEWLSALPKEVRLLGSGPRPGCVHVTNVYRGGHSGRRHTFILGLDDNRFPGAGLQDPVILDREREKLSKDLPTATGQLTAKLQDFARLLARVRGSVTLSYSCRDLIDDREVFPSQVVLSAYRLISGEQDADFTRLTERLPAPASFAPRDMDASLDAMDWWLGRLCKEQGLVDSDEIVSQHFPHLLRGRDAAQQRSSSDFTVYDGHIVNPGVELDPTSGAGRVMSAGSLESLARCPLLYFFRYVLELKPPEEPIVDPERWLNPADFGTLLHEILYDFVSDATERNWPPMFPDDLEKIRQIVRTRAELRKDMQPPPTEEAYLRQVNIPQDAVKMFLRVEAASAGRWPRYLETTAGMPSILAGTDLDTLEPVSLRLPDGREFRLRGRLDRIDCVGGSSEDRYSICDYKSGSATRFEHNDPFNQGRVLQHALYLAIGEARLRKIISRSARVEEFVYFFPGVRDQGLRLVYRAGDLSECVRVLQDLCQIAATGSFLPTDDPESDCNFCDYLGICSDATASARRSRNKLNNVNNVLLQPMRELRSRE